MNPKTLFLEFLVSKMGYFRITHKNASEHERREHSPSLARPKFLEKAARTRSRRPKIQEVLLALARSLRSQSFLEPCVD